MKKTKYIIAGILLVGIIGFIYYYINLPALNIHSKGFWSFLLWIMVILTTVICLFTSRGKIASNDVGTSHFSINRSIFHHPLVKISLIATILLFAIYLLGSLLSSPIVNAKKYQQLIEISERDFTKDIQEISYNEIPILDRDSAALLGSRKMGSMIEYVSQFEVSENYTQINYQNSPVRVTPLQYGSFFKWFTNRSKGIPAYIKIDMATQDVECVKLEQGMKYSESEHFGRYIYRYLRFKYPTYIFDTINFEINDEGVPFWVCPVKDFTIGLFGGQTVSRVVLVNAITGEHVNYKIEEAPTWIDRVYSSELLVSYYNYYGTLKHGYLNTLFSQKDCLQTTEGYNYIALEDDVWLYTGVTSVGGDESLIGFVLMNQRTAETRYYSISGAKEYSAMASAEGKVQNLGYRSTFPLLLNIANEPTYFIALKDSAGLVKKYAMVNIEKYTIVAIGDSVTDCEKDYIAQLKSNNVSITDTTTLPTITGRIKKIAEGVVDGNSHYYILLENNDSIFDVSVVDYIDILRYNVGDMITLTYTENNTTYTVLDITKN